MAVTIPMEAPVDPGFTAVQREYLQGLMAGVALRQRQPFVGISGGQFTAEPAVGEANLAEPAEETHHGFPLGEITKQEHWKRELSGLDSWDRLLEHAEQNKLPDEADTFRFRVLGLFHVSPAQKSLMLRCRIPAGELSSAQLHGLAEMAENWGNGKAAVTTRSNLQIREIAPKHAVDVLTRLTSLGLTARGSGVDNVRNITASPTAGIDDRELLDVRPYAHALHHYILNNRDLYDLPRKFNVAFDGGGAVDVVADTNDIGFMACRVLPGAVESPGAGQPAPGVYFRVELAGITGHKQFARDCGLLLQPGQTLALAAAMLRVFGEYGDRTDRKKARLKYLIDARGVDWFLAETQKRIAFPLVRFPLAQCQSRPPAIKHGHIGVYRQRQSGLNYVGVVVPVGILSVRQMKRLAELAEHYGSGRIRLTPWQNLIIPDVADGFVETLKRALVRAGLHYEATHILGGLVACTGNQGCKWSSTDTKGQALILGKTLSQRVRLDQPLNVHLTGCPNSCAQHYMGDIGMQGVKTNLNGESVEAYNIAFGGGFGSDQGVAQQVFTGIPFSETPRLLERVLRVYQAKRQAGESFAAFTRRHSVKQLQELFAE